MTMSEEELELGMDAGSDDDLDADFEVPNEIYYNRHDV